MPDEVPQEDRARFIEVMETEVMNLHEGNIARHRLRFSQFQAWKDMAVTLTPEQSSKLSGPD